MNHFEAILLGKMFLVVLMVIPCLLALTKNVFAQAYILASTPTGTTFCSTNGALTSVDMSNCTDAMALPLGSSAGRPSGGSLENGEIRYNTDTANIEAYSGSGWWNMVPTPTVISAFTNDVGYITNSALTPYLTSSTAASTYLTISGASSSYATASALTTGLSGKQPTITLGTSGQYVNGLLVATNFPTIPAAQVNSDWNASSGVAQILNKPTLATVATTGAYSDLTGKPTIPVVQSYENTTQHLNPILINKTATVAGGAGNAVFNLTNDGTSTGTALCPNGVMLNSPNLSVNDATAPYQFGWTWSNSNKTETVLAQKASGLAVLTFTLLGIPAPVPNGTVVNSTVLCY